MSAKSLLRAVTVLVVLSGSSTPPARAGTPAVPSPGNSTVPPRVILSGQSDSGGDANAEFAVVVRDLANNPVPGSLVEIDFTGCPGVRMCNPQPDPQIYRISCAPYVSVGKLADSQGRVSLRIVGSATGLPGGPSPLPACARVYADGVLLAEPTVVTPDLNGANGVDPGDLSIWLTVFFSGQQCTLADFNGSGTVDPGDLSEWLHFYFSGGARLSCGSPHCP